MSPHIYSALGLKKLKLEQNQTSSFPLSPLLSLPTTPTPPPSSTLLGDMEICFDHIKYWLHALVLLMVDASFVMVTFEVRKLQKALVINPAVIAPMVSLPLVGVVLSYCFVVPPTETSPPHQGYEAACEGHPTHQLGSPSWRAVSTSKSSLLRRFYHLCYSLLHD